MNSTPTSVAHLHHALFTGSILAAVSRLGTPAAAELVTGVFSRQREMRFLPGLAKLGLTHLPPAVAAAQYHYLSNHIGGVAVQYMPESERKAWIRYVPPRWIWWGTALCAIPPEVSAGMLRGWHAQAGLSLGNPRLGFVCTAQTAAGDAALEGYYFEADHALAPDERLRFAPGERGPEFDPALAPALPTADWPAGRLAKAHRNYAMEYLRTLWPVAIAQFGAPRALEVFGLAARQVGIQFFHETVQGLGLSPLPSGMEGWGRFHAAFAEAQDDVLKVTPQGEGLLLSQSGWTLFDAPGAVPDRAARPALCALRHALLGGLLAAHDARLVLQPLACEVTPPSSLSWRLVAKVSAD